MAMRRAAVLGARHILAASAASSCVTSRRHMGSVDAGAAMEKIRAAGLLRTQGLIGGKWVDAYDGKTIEIVLSVKCAIVKSTPTLKTTKVLLTCKFGVRGYESATNMLACALKIDGAMLSLLSAVYFVIS